jgi:glycosyltransferase involved in cell wall biosynthesis
MPRVLHVLAQRPGLTGSGVTLDALVAHAARGGWEQTVVVGTPVDDHPRLRGATLRPLRFAAERLSPLEPDLDLLLPGMSDVMPYPSSRYATLTVEQLAAYRAAWRRHLRSVLEDARPDVIHAHHVWIVSALIKELAPTTPLVIHCHATGLRQMKLCPHLADEVRRGCARAERFVVLYGAHARELAAALDVPVDRIVVVGAGYRDDLFSSPAEPATRGRRLLYVGKYSAAKGLPWLLDAVERLAGERAGLELHVAGSGAGAEADALEQRMRALGPLVVLHGQLPQPALAALMRRCAVCVLPSLYEGVPLVLVEALACGCRLVATALPGVREEIVPHLGDDLELVPLPRLTGVDTPLDEDQPRFVDDLACSLTTALARTPLAAPPVVALRHFTWSAVFRRVAAQWRALCGDKLG